MYFHLGKDIKNNTFTPFWLTIDLRILKMKRKFFTSWLIFYEFKVSQDVVRSSTRQFSNCGLNAMTRHEKSLDVSQSVTNFIMHSSLLPRIWFFIFFKKVYIAFKRNPSVTALFSTYNCPILKTLCFWIERWKSTPRVCPVTRGRESTIVALTSLLFIYIFVFINIVAAILT